VLGALADALRLGPTDRVHLYRLVKAADLTFSCLGGRAPARTVRALLDRLEPGPALLLNRLSDIVAHTSGYDRLARPLGLLDGDPPNLARYVFTDERARTAFPDWDRVADEQVAALKEGPFRADPFLAGLADELTVTAGAAFERRASQLPRLAPATGVTRLAHPEAGELRLAYETLRLPADDDQRLLVYLPADGAAAAALDRLTGRRPGALRAVPG
jgi:hypothetical protein